MTMKDVKSHKTPNYTGASLANERQTKGSIENS